MNATQFIGNLTKDPHFIPAAENKSAVAFMTVAQNEGERVTFIPVTVYGKTAEYAGNHLKKGSRVAITGKLQQRDAKTQNGEKYQELYVSGRTLQNLSATASNGDQEA